MGLTWSAGAHSVQLRVPVGTPLAGYGSRTAKSSGTLRPIEANMLALAAGSSAASVLIALDLLAIDANWVRALRVRLLRDHGIAPELVLVGASHTHSGPSGFRKVGATSPDDSAARRLRREFLDTVSAGVAAALRQLGPAELRLSRATCDVAAHRGDPSLPVDGQLTRLDVCRPDGQPLALLWHFTCHATVLAADNTLVSPDLPGEVRADLRRRHGADLPVLYFNGAAADVSTRFTRAGQTPEELSRLARRVSDSMPEAGQLLAPATVPRGRLARCVFPSVTESPEAVEERLQEAHAKYRTARRSLDPTSLRVLETAVVGLRKRLDHARGLNQGRSAELAATVQLIDLGQLALIGIPGELFSHQGQEIRSLANISVLPVGYAGDYLGYLPPTGQTAGYEADSAVVAAGAGDRVVAAASRLLVEGAAR